MERTRKQVANIRKGCKKRDKQLIIDAQKKRHLKTKITQAILEKIKQTKNIENTIDWLDRLEALTEQVALEKLLKEIQK